MTAPNEIYQYSLINALMAGVADSGIPVSDFISKGNIGLGTFTKIKGELILLDGKVYQLQASGEIRTAGPEEQLPYAVATQFVPQKSIKVKLDSKDDITKILEDFDSHAANLFMSYRIDGKFQKLKARTVRGQEYEDQPLAELGKKQAVQDYEDIEGTVVGLRAPASWQGVTVGGNHMHFIDQARKVGGHVLEMVSGGEVEVQMAVASHLHIELPTSAKFNAANMKTDDEGVKGIEG
jgi:alpha-acetolactate decarboxylase